MAHPQNNFTSQFQENASSGNAALTLNINGVPQTYTPRGTDQTVAISEPVVFELNDNPTYAEVNEVVASHIPCYLHVSGNGVDYMAPYVGNTTNAFRFETTNAPGKELVGWLIRNGTSPLAYANSYSFEAGPNIDISDGTISTQRTVVKAGRNISVTSSFDASTKTSYYKVTATGAQRFARSIPKHDVTTNDVANGYADIPIYIWPSDQMSSLSVGLWFLLIKDVSYIRESTGSSLQGYATKLKISWCDGTHTWMSYDNAHGNDPEGQLFEDIPASDLARIGGYPVLVHPIRKIGGDPTNDTTICGPSIRVMFEPGAARVGDRIHIDGSIQCITQ